MTAIVLRILAVLILLISAVLIGVQYSSYSWARTEGVVASSQWSREGLLGTGVKGDYQVRYEYTIDGRNHVSDRLSFAGNLSIARVVRTFDGLDTNVDRSPRPGDTVIVHYATWWPAMSVLVVGPSPTAWIWGVVAVLMAIGLFGFAQISKHPVY